MGYERSGEMMGPGGVLILHHARVVETAFNVRVIMPSGLCSPEYLLYQSSIIPPGAA